jgi:hypothetical protein
MSKRKVLFLDIDGVLTTGVSRTLEDLGRFDSRCVRAIEKLCVSHAKPDLIVLHTSWRKFTSESPYRLRDFSYVWNLEDFIQDCIFQGAENLAKIPMMEAPFSDNSDRVEEVARSISDIGESNDSYVIIDDEWDVLWTPDNTMIIHTDDFDGLTHEHVDRIIEWWE